MSGERGGILIGWFLRVFVGLAVAGVLLFEGAAIVIANVGADNASRTAAQEAVGVFAHSRDVRAARAEAEKIVRREGSVLVGFSADDAGAGGQERVNVTVAREAKTLFIHRIGPLRRFVRVRSSARAFSV